MYDVTSVVKRYFEVKLTAEDDEGKAHSTVIEVGPPRLKTLEELMDIATKSSEADQEGTITQNVIAELRDAIKKLLSKNKSGYKVPDEYVKAMDFDQMTGLLNAFFGWLNDTKTTKN